MAMLNRLAVAFPSSRRISSHLSFPTQSLHASHQLSSVAGFSSLFRLPSESLINRHACLRSNFSSYACGNSSSSFDISSSSNVNGSSSTSFVKASSEYVNLSSDYDNFSFSFVKSSSAYGNSSSCFVNSSSEYVNLSSDYDNSLSAYNRSHYDPSRSFYHIENCKFQRTNSSNPHSKHGGSKSHSNFSANATSRIPRYFVMGTSALLFSKIGGDPPDLIDGKTRTEKMLALSRHQLEQIMLQRRRRYGPVVEFFLKYIWDPLMTWLRVIELFSLFTPVVLSSLPIAFGIAPEVYRDLWYKLLLKIIETAGPSFIKLGQWAASRSDIFPADLINVLSQLHSNAKQHGMAHTRRVVSQSFGKPFDLCFEEFDEKPLGVGAMGQVYRAHYRSKEYTGDVAVKVLHPNVEVTIMRDLSIMRVIAAFINALPTMEWLSLPGEVETFGRMMQSQLDLRLEAQNLRTFNENFEDDPEISFPRASLGVSSRELLVEQLVHGVSMEKVLKFCRQTEYDRSVAQLGLDAFLQMLLLHNFIHSDLHAGNIFLTLDNRRDPKQAHDLLQKLKNATTQEEWDTVWDKLSTKTDRPHLWFIDAGLVTELSPCNRLNFIDLFRAIATFDGYKAGELMVERSRTPETVVDKEVFALRTERLVSQVKKRTFALGSVGIGDLLATMMDMVRRHHVRMESDFITVVLSILLLEGIGRRLDPQLDIFKAALPVLRKASHIQATPGVSTELSADDMVQMLKVWLVLETRQFINTGVQEVYRCVKYDRLSPNT